MHPLLYPEQGSSATRHLLPPVGSRQHEDIYPTPTYPSPVFSAPAFRPAKVEQNEGVSSKLSFFLSFLSFFFFFSLALPNCRSCAVAPSSPLIFQPAPLTQRISILRFHRSAALHYGDCQKISCVFQLLVSPPPSCSFVCAKNERAPSEKKQGR